MAWVWGGASTVWSSLCLPCCWASIPFHPTTQKPPPKKIQIFIIYLKWNWKDQIFVSGFCVYIPRAGSSPLILSSLNSWQREQHGQNAWEMTSVYGASTRPYFFLSFVLYFDPIIHWEHNAGIISKYMKVPMWQAAN